MINFYKKFQIQYLCSLEKRQSCFLCGLKILIDQFTDYGSLLMVQRHALVVSQTASHVPAQFDRLRLDHTYFFFHVLHQFFNLCGVTDQEATSKKLVMSRVNDCSYSLPQLLHLICNGLISLLVRSSNTKSLILEKVFLSQLLTHSSI